MMLGRVRVLGRGEADREDGEVEGDEKVGEFHFVHDATGGVTVVEDWDVERANSQVGSKRTSHPVAL